jgi:hypothetical protein
VSLARVDDEFVLGPEPAQRAVEVRRLAQRKADGQAQKLFIALITDS